MNKVMLKSDGELILESNSIDERAIQHLGYQIQLADDCDLRCFFHLLERYPVFTQLSEYFPMLKTQYDECPDSGCQWPEFDSLQFSKTIEMIGYPGEPRLEMYHNLLGIGPGNAEEIRHLPLEVLLDMPLRLGPLKHTVFGDRMDILEFGTVYTLFEFIDGIAWALSFHSAPTQCLTRS